LGLFSCLCAPFVRPSPAITLVILAFSLLSAIGCSHEKRDQSDQGLTGAPETGAFSFSTANEMRLAEFLTANLTALRKRIIFSAIPEDRRHEWVLLNIKPPGQLTRREIEQKEEILDQAQDSLHGPDRRPEQLMGSYCQMLCMEVQAAAALSSCSIWPSARTPSRNSTPGITSFR
jgi:hypothetical protein